MNYRPKNCMKCGGKKKMQGGGMAAAKAHPLTTNAVNQHIFDVTGQIPDSSNGVTAMSAGLGMNALSDVLAEISGRVDRGRQDQYMMNQFSALGQMNPMPVNDFQPNPYSLYAKYGGSIKKHIRMVDRGFTNNAEMDMTGRAEFQGGGLSRAKDYGSSSHPYPSVSSGDFAGPHRSYPIPTRADAVDALRLAHLHGRSDVIAKVHEKYPGLKKGGWIKSAVNPAHKGYCTPMSKPTCTGHRRAFALMMKKKHGFHKH